jgi:hypothetical protein
LLAGGFALNNNPPPSSGGGMPNKMLPLMGVGLLPTMLHLLMPKLQLSTGVSLG